MPKLTLTQLKKHLKSKSAAELVKDIGELYNKFSDVKDYYQSTLTQTGKGEVFNKYKLIVRNEFFPLRGEPKMRLSVARKAVNDFKKMSSSPEDIADLMIFYVECGVEFTNEYGDIDEPFYCSMENMYNKALKYIVKTNQDDKFYKRCKKIIEDTDDIGWGFNDGLSDSFYEYMKE